MTSPTRVVGDVQTRIDKFFLLIAAFWTIVILAAFALNYREAYSSAMAIARAGLFESYSKDLVYRGWATIHGGVYVPITPDTPANPYLADIPERDITTPSGKKLALMNPAYMTRQVHELGEKQYNHKGHITSLKPIRPENAADQWEKKALIGFEQGEKEGLSLETIDNKTYLRFMRPLVVEKGCLKCHESQGYKLGDIRGGISVSTPWAPTEETLFSQMRSDTISYGGIWLLGILGLLGGRTSIRHHMSERKLAEEAQVKSHEDLQEANSQIMDSIDYARSIQSAILPPDERLRYLLDDYFVIWSPRDVIGGDLYWVEGSKEELVLAVMDCTGHGVPGAIMTMIAATSLNRALHEIGFGDPGALLGRMNILVRDTLTRRPEGRLYDDGLDMGICRIDRRSREATFAGGRISLFICSDGKADEIKGDPESIGYQSCDPDYCFRNHCIQLKNHTNVYLTTDGLIEQIGGRLKLPFGKSHFIRFISDNYGKPLLDQKHLLYDEFIDYRGEEDQRDDVTVLGFRI